MWYGHVRDEPGGGHLWDENGDLETWVRSRSARRPSLRWIVMAAMVKEHKSNIQKADDKIPKRRLGKEDLEGESQRDFPQPDSATMRSEKGLHQQHQE